MDDSHADAETRRGYVVQIATQIGRVAVLRERAAHAPTQTLAPSMTGPEANTGRIEMFSDGVFAIAITLLVLDLHVPLRSELDNESLWNALGDHWTTYLSFLISFLIVAVAWTNHRTMFSFIQRADHALVILNTLLLLDVVTLPFCAALLGEYIRDPTERQTALIVYIGTVIVGGIIYNILWHHAAHRHRLLAPDVDPRTVHTLSKRYFVGPILYAAALGLAFLNSIASIVVCAVLTLLYLLPGFTQYARRAA